MVRGLNLLCAAALVGDALSCTLIALGPKATADGSTMAIQTNDCIDCDFRLANIPAKKHDAGEKYPVWQFRNAYPRYVGDDRGDLYKLDNVDRTIYPWNNTEHMGYIDQVAETHGYLEGAYPMINDQGLGFGESTCAARLVGVPVSAGGHAMFDVGQLMRVASERTKTAREAIQLMGDLAVEHGFYGAAWEGAAGQAEGGEALGVIDQNEAWLFHVLGDDTGKSAVWVAQRIPDDHIAVVANQFVIRAVDLTDEDKFMGSDNMEEVALRAGLWKKEQGSLAAGTFDFTKAFSMPHGALAIGVTRRVWRVYGFTAPSVELPGETDEYGSDYPVTLKVDAAVSKQDIMHILRDHYEGTPYDMSKGLAAGPFGNPNRFDKGANHDGVTAEMAHTGTFERSISWFTTAYSHIAQSRADLPLPISPVAWLGFYAPDASVYHPFYPAAPSLDKSVQSGSLFKLDRENLYWAHAATAGYADRFYKHTYAEIREIQAELENKFVEQQEQVEQDAVEMLKEGTSEDGVTGYDAAARHLADFSATCSRDVLDRMWTFFDTMLSKYKDGYRLDDPHAETYKPTNFFYPLSWLERVGFFPNAKTNPLCNGEDGTAANDEAQGMAYARVGVQTTIFLMVVAGAIGGAIGVTMGMRSEKRKAYTQVF